MPSPRVKSREQIRTEFLINNFGYVLLQLFLWALGIVLLILYIIAHILHLPALYSILSAWVCSTRLARKTRNTCSYIYHNVNPVAALLVFGSLGSLPIVVGSTIEENGPEIELLQLQVKALAREYLPAFTFFVGLFLPYIVLRILPGYDSTCAGINDKLHAPRSILELLDHQSLPGEFPFTPSRTMIAEIKDLIFSKDNEIADLRTNLEQEDEQIVETMAEKDEEIANYQNSLQEKDQEILDLQAAKNSLTQQLASRPVHPTSNTSAIADEHTQQLEAQLKDAMNCNEELQKVLVSWRGQAEVYEKNSIAQIQYLESQLSREAIEATNWQSKAADGNKQISQLHIQMSTMKAEASTKHQSTVDAYTQQISKLEAQLSQRSVEATTTQQTTLNEYSEQISELKAQLSKRDADIANAQHSSTVKHEQEVLHLKAQLSQRDSDLASAEQSFTAKHEQELLQLRAQLSQRDSDLASAQQSIEQLRAQPSSLTHDLANAQQTNVALQTELSQSQLTIAEMNKNCETHTQRLTYLESQCVKADQLYGEYQRLLQAYNHLRNSPPPSQPATSQANSSEAELNAARQQIAELTRSKEQLEQVVEAPARLTILHEMALAEKDKEIEKVRKVLQRVQENLDAVRNSGRPSAAFLAAHSALQKDRDALKVKARRLEDRLYPLEIKVANLQARVRSHAVQLDRLGYPTATLGSGSSNLEVPTDLTVLRAVQAERDLTAETLQQQAIKSQETLAAALSSVEWQLEGRTSAETEQKCKELEEVHGNNLGARLSPLLQNLRWQLESAAADAKHQLGMLDEERIRLRIRVGELEAPEASPRPQTGVAGKRKGAEGGEDRVEGAEDGREGKRPHHE